MNSWEWEEGSILYNTSPYTAPKEIFQSVCNELGRYYTEKGAKYTKSNRKIKWLGKKLRCEIRFNSSHSNMAGSWINLEVVTNTYAIDCKDMERKGILNFNVRPTNFNVYRIDNELFFEIIKFIDATLKLIWSYETKEGLDKFYAGISEGHLRFVEGNPNNRLFYNSL